LLERKLWEKLGAAPVDYVICCGNITTDGSPASFVAAEKILGEFVDQFLAGANGKPSHVGNRVLLLPGRRDLAPAGSLKEALAPFATFWSRFYRAYHEAEINFSAEDVILKELKDLTIIAVCFWNQGPSNSATQHRELFFQRLHKAQERLLNLQYCSRTPTVLVSPESPVVAWIRLTESAARLASVKHLGIDFHLFGSSPIWCVFEPFGFRHAGLSTGPRDRRRFLPIRINLLEFSSPTPRGVGTEDDVRRSRVSVTLFEKVTKQVDWRRERIVDDSLNTIVEPQGWSAPEFRYHETFAEDLAFNLQRLAAGSIAIEYLPGQGMELYLPGRGLELVPTSAARPEMVFEDILSYDDVFDLTEGFVSPESQTFKALRSATERLLARAKAVRDHQADRQPSGSMDVICVLRDKALARIPVEHRRRWLGLIRDDLRALESEGIPVVYATTPSDSSADVREIFKQPMVAPPLSLDTVRRLLDFYGRLLPLEPSRFERWCGRFVGLWNEMLGAAKEEFGQWPGAIQLDLAQLRELPRQASLRPNIQDLLERFVTSMEGFQGWHPVYSYLRDLCNEAIESDRTFLPSFSINEIVERSGEESIRVENLLEILVRLGVVYREEGRSASTSFTLGALLFFLWPGHQAREALATQPLRTGKRRYSATNPTEAKVEDYEFDVFISYRHGARDEIFAKELYKLLRKERWRVAIDKQTFKAGQSLLSEIERCTLRSRCTVAIVSRRYLESYYTEEEVAVRLAVDLAARNRRLAPILIDELQDGPDWLFEVVTIDWTSPDEEVDPLEKVNKFIRDVRS
jgi:hypothetical protein